MLAQQILETVTADFEQVNQLIRTQLFSDVPLVEKIAHYIVESGGKRMRPMLVLLTTNALGYAGQDHIKLATIIEFLHTATLLHDDVVDMSSLRRGRETANARWGNAPSVLVGDFLYSRAFQMMVEIQSMPVMSILANATNVIAEGEVFQLMNCKNPDVTEAQYMEVIKNKTAMLFEAASHTGAVLASASTEQEKALQDYGLNLGLAFQLVDDLLDYQGSAETMGKNVGDDLAEGKPTLPLIFTMRNGTEAQKQLIRKAIRKGGLDDLPEIVDAVRASGALAYTENLAREKAEIAIECLSCLPSSRYKDALEGLARLSVNRNH
ncbi:MAG: octaprenyl diphosphate synthase [Hahellaceae bacterium]|nr:octaprenyl diphosphate synthase [Hahellaceae bacterium]MCP5168857.1 octaprenyl diphosphate synthase [Hahellaceae bacterium]